VPTPKSLITFSIDSTDKFSVSYYCEGTQDYADVTFHINGVLRECDFRVTIGDNGKSVLWQRAVEAICYSKELLKSIMGRDYSPANNRVVAYDDVAQEMLAKKVRPENKLYWGTPQVVRLKWECTGTPTIIKRDYPIDYVATDSNKRRNRQRNTILIIRMKKAQQRSAAAAEIDAGEIDLFGMFSQSQASSDFSPAQQRRKKRSSQEEIGDRGDERK
jgi:predicted porin